jgi:hypothetical protein
MVNFYRRFLPNCAQVLHPMSDLLKGGPKKLEWTAMAQEAFQNAKLSPATDTSDNHIGSIMQQKSGDHW